MINTLIPPRTAVDDEMLPQVFDIPRTILHATDQRPFIELAEYMTSLLGPNWRVDLVWDSWNYYNNNDNDNDKLQ